MLLESPLKEKYGKEHQTALQAQHLAHEIAFGPIVFQVSRLMVKFGILRLLDDNKNGLTMEEVAEKAQLSLYGAKVLLEASLSIGTVLHHDDRFFISKAGWFLLNDEMVKVHLDFNHDVNYLGMFELEEAIRTGKPAGLKHLGNWPTIYEGLSQLPADVSKSWFAFDHFYSDNSFSQALDIVFSRQPKNILDVGGNTGRWAMQCVGHNPDVRVCIMDLPQQLGLMREATKGQAGADRIDTYPANLLNPDTKFPLNYDAIWMSQFLDCFSEEEIVSILQKAAKAMGKDSRLYIMETLWDRQRFETASYCLTLISIYFTAMANGNSKMYHSDDLFRCIQNAGLEIVNVYDGIGLAHSIIEVRTES